MYKNQLVRLNCIISDMLDLWVKVKRVSLKMVKPEWPRTTEGTAVWPLLWRYFLFFPSLWFLPVHVFTSSSSHHSTITITITINTATTQTQTHKHTLHSTCLFPKVLQTTLWIKIADDPHIQAQQAWYCWARHHNHLSVYTAAAAAVAPILIRYHNDKLRKMVT